MICKHSLRWRSARRDLLIGLAATSVFSLQAQPGYSLRPVERKPSIIFILADDLGFGEVQHRSDLGRRQGRVVAQKFQQLFHAPKATPRAN